MKHEETSVGAEHRCKLPEYLLNLDALQRIGVYLSEELELLGSTAVDHARLAVEVIEMELKVCRDMIKSSSTAAQGASLLPPTH